MSLRARPALLALLLLAGVGAARPAQAGEPSAFPVGDWLGPRPLFAPSTPSAHPPTAKGRAGTQCELCHTPEGWGEARFPHDQTGFPLRFAHEQVACKDCHAKDLTTPVPRTCGGCHTDLHRGDFGQRCEGCHDERTWRAAFSPEAHRGTNFPLLGAHASLPCVECHAELRNARFVRATVDCQGCHLADWNRTRGTPVDHAALSFSTQCRDCHGGATFKNALFPAHEACFQLAVGPHANLECSSCHTSLPAAALSKGACNTGTAACSSCHEHACVRTDPIHKSVPGYQCKDQKCYSCHRFSTRP